VLEGTGKRWPSGEPLQYASVAVVDANTDTISTGGLTNKKGHFRIAGLSAGIILLR
jgi:hypothetical protein